MEKKKPGNRLLKREQKKTLAAGKRKASRLLARSFLFTFVLGMLCVALSREFKWFPLSMILLIFTILAAQRRYRQHISLDGYSWLLLIASLCLILAGSAPHQPDGIAGAWKPAFAGMGVFALIFTWSVYGVKMEKGLKTFTIAIYTLFSIIPSMGIVLYCNHAFDFSTAEKQAYDITHKWTRPGKTTTYIVQFTPAWMKNGMPMEAKVTKKYYNLVETGQQQYIAVRKGLLGVRWYELDGER